VITLEIYLKDITLPQAFGKGGEYVPLGYLEIMSYQVPMDIAIRRKHPDHLVDSCKCSNVNQMAAGLSWVA